MALVEKERAKRAHSISTFYGNSKYGKHVSNFELQYERGINEWKDNDISIHKDGGYDQRSSTFRSGSACLNSDRVTMDGRSKVARGLKKKYVGPPL